MRRRSIKELARARGIRSSRRGAPGVRRRRGNPAAIRVAISARTRLVKPASAFGSKIMLGNPERIAESITGPAAYPPTPKARREMMSPQDRQRIPKRQPQQQNIVNKLRRTHTLETRRANQFQLESRFGHKPRFDSALRAHENDISCFITSEPFPRDSDRGNHMAARAAARNQQFQAATAPAIHALLHQSAG